MNEKKDLELFYILPHTKNYNSGGYYRNDETCSIAYRSPSESIWYGNPLVFDNKEQLLNWFYKNANKLIPTVYRIKYIGYYLGLDDVIKITNLTNDETGYYTPLNKNMYARYDRESSKEADILLKEGDKFLWVESLSSSCIYKFDYIYEELRKRGIKTKHNVYKQDIDKTNCFEYIGDPFVERAESKGKKLILLHRRFW